MNLLQVRRVSKRFGGNQVLTDVSLNVQAGEVFALIGDNGAGKSTLLRIMSGDRLPDSGEIFLQEQCVTGLSPRGRRALGVEMIYQDLALAPQQDAVANIFLGRELVRWVAGCVPVLDERTMRERAARLLGELGAHVPATGTPVRLLSGGQQQAVAIARALIFEARILLMDEPTAALGVREAAGVLELIKKLKARGIAVVLISHRPHDVLAVADRIALLEHGRLAWEKPSSELTLNTLIEALAKYPAV